jgi:septal ring factor EnvC (AmiA/AmiB activator)
MEWNMDNDKQITKATPSSNFDLIDKETRLFFQEETMKLLKGDTPDFYDLETEFAKAKRNRSWFVILIVLGVVIATACGLFIVTGVINRRTRDVPESINAFDDLNLKDLLDMASRIEFSYQSTLTEKSALEGELSVELSKLEANAEAERATIHSLSLPRNEESSRVAQVNAKLSAEVEDLKAKHEESLRALNVKLEEYRTQLASFDKGRIEQAEEQRKTANAEYLRFEHEKEAIRAQYEETIANLLAGLSESQKVGLQAQMDSVDAVSSKYKAEISALDPVWTNEQNNALIESVGTPDGADPLPNESMRALSDLNAAYRNMNALSSDLLTIPWKNNTPSYVQAMDALFYETLQSAGGELQQLSNNAAAQKQAFEEQISELQASLEAAETDASALSSQVDALSSEKDALSTDNAVLSAEKNALSADKNALIHDNAVLSAERDALSADKNALIRDNAGLSSNLDFANNLLARDRRYFRSVTERNGAAGYVIDPINRTDILVYIDPLFGLSFDGQKAFIFRTGNEYVGTVAISGADRVFTARTLELAPGMTIEPNDKILLETSRRSAN